MQTDQDQNRRVEPLAVACCPACAGEPPMPKRLLCEKCWRNIGADMRRALVDGWNRYAAAKNPNTRFSRQLAYDAIADKAVRLAQNIAQGVLFDTRKKPAGKK